MKKYFSLIKYEMKSILKDPLNIFMLFYPFFILFILGVIIPLSLEKIDSYSYIVILIILIMALSLGAFLIGALLGFSFIENKDEKTILGISVTPLKVEGYTIFKVVYATIFSFIGNIVIVGGLKIISNDIYVINEGSVNLLENITWIHVIVFSAVSSLFSPVFALIIASIAKNKIEGFALMKSSSIILFFPLLILIPFFENGNQFLLSVFPNFWTIKGILTVATNSLDNNLNFYLYMLIGAVYSFVIMLLSIKMFINKQNVN
ncbi:MAG: hypothetical protein WC006_08525 [Bacilli bacterium]